MSAYTKEPTAMADAAEKAANSTDDLTTAPGFCQCGCGERAPLATHTNTKRGTVKGQSQRYVLGHHARIYLPRGETWQPSGYVYVQDYEAPRYANGGIRRRGQHVVLVERAIGKRLPRTAEVHHFDGNRSNNAPGNLVACQNHTYHQLLHRRQEALAACGNPRWRQCWRCGEWSDPKYLVMVHERCDGHPGCIRARGKTARAS